jgi:hypothetical protein
MKKIKELKCQSLAANLYHPGGRQRTGCLQPPGNPWLFLNRGERMKNEK